MGARKVFWLTVAGLLIGGSDQYFQVHLGGPYGVQYWLGMVFAGLVPVGSYLIGLAQPRVSSTFNEPQVDWESRYRAQRQLSDDLRAAVRKQPRASSYGAEHKTIEGASVYEAFAGRKR